MKSRMFVELETSPTSGYISVRKMFFEEDLEYEYETDIEAAKYFGFRRKVETLEGYKLRFIELDVNFDGRKRKITEEDILHSLEQQGLLTKKGGGMFGDFYAMNASLEDQLDKQLKQRKELINNGQYVVIAS